MSAVRVAVLRCRRLPRFVTWEIPDVDALFGDDRQLIAALEALGVEAESVVWADPDIDWDGFDVAVLRSTWDYIDETAAFLDTLAVIEASSCALVNSASVAEWNARKTYLFDLAERGVPIVPAFEATGATRAAVAAAEREVAASGWQTVVVKPVVGAGASDVRRLPAAELGATLRALDGADEARPGRPFLVQPLVESVMSEGEWSYILIDGAVSHVLRKRPATGDYRAHGIYGGTVEPATPTRDDLAQIEDMWRALPFDLAYARLDVLRVDDRLAVLELEAIEPMLYLDLAPGSADRLARAVLARSAGS